MPRRRPSARPHTRLLSWAATWLLRWSVRAKQWLIATVERSESEPTDLTGLATAPVIAYFGDHPATVYQIRQWLPVLEIVAERRPVLVVTREHATTRTLRTLTELPIARARSIDDLLAMYRHVDAKVVVYVNNGMLNFQSLIYQRALHVHVNHGESDKVSMVSNQAKAYDRVVVAGRAAVERHRRALIDLPADKLAVCGRPQLDRVVEPSLPPAPPRTRTVLYAPTWSGESAGNNYTSLDRYGVAIARAVLDRADLRLVYRPHPRVIDGNDPACVDAHASIVRMIEAAGRDGAHHLMPFDDDPMAVFDGVDLLVTDVSSIGLDFLYLRPDAPVVLTDRRTDRERLLAEAPVARACDVVDEHSVGQVAALLDRNLGSDPHLDSRRGVRDHYFGFARHESTRRFQELIEECIERRDELVGRLPTA